MILMRIREIASCMQHKRTIIILEDVHQCLRPTFYADPDEACRLAQVGLSSCTRAQAVSAHACPTPRPQVRRANPSSGPHHSDARRGWRVRVPHLYPNRRTGRTDKVGTGASRQYPPPRARRRTFFQSWSSASGTMRRGMRLEWPPARRLCVIV